MKSKNMEISVSLDPAMPDKYKDYLKKVNKQKDIDSIHLDVMDGDFVPRRSADDFAVVDYILANTEMPIDVHFMVATPAMFVALNIKKAFRSITIQYESTNPGMLKPLLAKIKEYGKQAGIAIDLDTPVADVCPEIITQCDTITIMSVKAGASGQSFNPSALEKIGALKKINPNLHIIVDGGINFKNKELVSQAGANIAVMGSAMYKELN